MAIAPEITHPAELLALPETAHYFNRELSWLEFNRRVLEEALDQQNPLLERVKFLSIFSTNLDEFFMIRVAGIKQQVAAGVIGRSPDGTTPAEQFYVSSFDVHASGLVDLQASISIAGRTVEAPRGNRLGRPR